MEKITKIWIWVIVIFGVIAVASVVLINIQTVKQITTWLDSVQSAQDISAEDIGVATAPISYNEALLKYVDRRIQLDEGCRAQPNNVTYKDNTGIMIDNRSAQTRTVKVGITFTIKPWGFKIVLLPDVYLKSKTILVDCDKLQNVATILVQE